MEDTLRDLIRLHDENSTPIAIDYKLGEELGKDRILQLIRQGYRVDLTNYPSLLCRSILDNNIEEVTTLADCYNNHTIKIHPHRVDYRIVEILKPRLLLLIDHNVTYRRLTVQQTMNLIANTNPHRSIKMSMEYLGGIVYLYARLLKRPISILVKRGDKRILNHHPINHTDLQYINVADRTILLQGAIEAGDYSSASLIIDSYTEDGLMVDPKITNLDIPSTLTGMRCMLTLLDSYDWITTSRNSVIVDLINEDINLEYCMGDDFRKYMNELDESDHLQITNRQVMRTLKGVVQDTNYWINAEFEDDSDDEHRGQLLDYAIRAIPVTDYIDNSNIEKVLGILDNEAYREDCYVTVMHLLIKLHMEKLIDIRSYSDSHPYIKFIVDRLPVNSSSNVKNARSSDRI